MSKKSLILSIPLGMSARNILRSATFDILRAHARVIILTPLHSDPNFLSEFGKDNVEIHGYRPIPLAVKALMKILIDVETLQWVREKRIKTFEIIEGTLKAGKADDILKTYSGIFSGYSKLLGSMPGLVDILKKCLFRWIACCDPYQALLKEWNPTLIFFTHSYTLEERALSIFAAKHRIKTVNMIHSWDNVTTKPKMLSQYDRMVVWNEILKQQLVDLYDYHPSQIFVSGMPQADIYTQKELFLYRETFLTRLGLDPGKKLLTFVCPAPEFVPDQHEVIKVILDAMETRKFAYDVSLLIRHLTV